MPFSITWDEAYPAGSDASAGIDTYIQEDKTAVRERLESLMGIANFSTRFPMSADALKMDGAANTYIKGGTASWSLRETTGVTSFISVDTVTGVVTFAVAPVFTLGLGNLVTGSINNQTISAAANFTGTLNVVDDFNVNTNKFSVDGPTGNTLIAGTLEVTGAINSQTISATANFTGTLNVVDDFSVATNKFTIDGPTGNVTIAGTALISGVATFTLPWIVSDANVAGARTLSIKNTNTSGTGYASFAAQNDGRLVFLAMFSSGFTSAGTNFASGASLVTDGAGGLSIGTTAAGVATRMYAGNGLVATFVASPDPGLNVSGILYASGNFKINTNKFTVEASSGNTLIAGTLTATGAFGCNAATAQTAYASGGALAAYSTGAFGFDSDAHASELHAMVVKIRAALVANGIMS